MNLKTWASILSILLFASACKTGNIPARPEAPLIERCVYHKGSGNEICYYYKFDVIGGYTQEDSLKIRPHTDRSICHPPDEYKKFMDWRDETIMWAEDLKKQFSR